MVTVQPGTGCARREASAASSGIWMRRPTVRAVSLSFGTRKVILPKPPGAASVVETPTWAEATVAEPVDVTLPLQSSAGEDGTVQISLDPARTGANTLHVYLFDEAGQLTQPEDIRVTLTEPGQEIGPLAVDLEPAGPGHYVGDDVVVPSAGTWTLAVTVRLDEFTATTASTDFPVR